MSLILRELPFSRSLTTHGRSSSEAILSGVGHRKLTLPNVGKMLASWLQLVAPREKPVSRDTGISPINRHRIQNSSQGKGCNERPICSK
jgi:hypothetical protein